MDRHPIDRFFSDRINREKEWGGKEIAWNEALSMIRDSRRKRRQVVVWWILGMGLLVAVSLLIFDEWKESPEKASHSNPVIANSPQSLPDPSQYGHTIDSLLSLSKGKSNVTSDRSPYNPNVELDAAKSDSGHQPEILLNSRGENGLPQYENIHDSGPGNNTRLSKLTSKNASKESDVRDTHSMESKVQSNPTRIREEGVYSNLELTDERMLNKMELLASIGLSENLKSVNEEKLLEINPPSVELSSELASGGIKPTISGIKSSWTAEINMAAAPGILSKPGDYQGYKFLLGRQFRMTNNLGIEFQGGGTFIQTNLPVHQQSIQQTFDVGYSTTTYQLQAESVVTLGMRMKINTGVNKHRIFAYMGADKVVAAYGDYREMYFEQAYKLQDRNAKPILVNEENTWLDTDGLRPIVWSAGFGYNYQITKSIELGLSWEHRLSKLVETEKNRRDHVSIVARKLF